MPKAAIDKFGMREQAILLVVILLMATASMVLFGQQKVLYYLIGLIVMGVMAWCQFSIKRWVYLTIIFIPTSVGIPVLGESLPVGAELSDFLVWMAIFIYLLNTIISPMRKKKFDYYIWFPLALYILTNIASSLFGFYAHRDSMLVINALGHLLKWTSYLILSYIVLNVFKTEQQMKTLLKVIFISFAASSLITLYNYFTNYAGTVKLYRAAGLAQEGTNGRAVTFAVILVYFYNLIMQGKDKELFPRWLYLVFWNLMLLAVITSFSRTAWVALWSGVIGLSILRKRRYVAVILLIVAAINFVVLRGPVERRIKATFEKQPWSTLPVDLGGRDSIWKTAVKRVGFHHLLGVGYSNFGLFLMGTTAHSQFISILGESGILGLCAFIFLLYRILKSHLFMAQYHPKPFFRECAIGNMAGYTILILASFMGEYFYMAPLQGIMFSIYVVILNSYEKENQADLSRGRPLRLAVRSYGFGPLHLKSK